MEVRLIIFLAFVAITLIINTVIIWMVYKTFGNMASKVAESAHEFQTSTSTREWLTAMHTASAEAVKVTGAIKDQVLGFEPTLARMQSEHTERLSKTDVRFKLTFRALHFTAEKVEKLVVWPIQNIRKTSGVLEGIIAFIRGVESDSDARPRRTR